MGKMVEAEMHQVWATKAFDVSGLRTVDGRPILLADAGRLNTCQGPDFLGGRIYLDGLELHGDVELHLDSADWFRHGHHLDKIYNGVMLHVVMDRKPGLAVREDGHAVPTLTIGDRIDRRMPHGGRSGLVVADGLGGASGLPCGFAATRLGGERLAELLEEAGMERVHAKLARMRATLAAVRGDWEEMVWVELARAMGGPVNADAFEDLARRLPYKVLRRYARSPLSSEALLFGVAGLLERPAWDEYHTRLIQEWEFLSGKHSLVEQHSILKLHRMRPASFPCVRLAQLVALLGEVDSLAALAFGDPAGGRIAAEVAVGSYWRRNLHFGTPGTISVRALGQQQRQSLLINVLHPASALFKEAHGLGEAGAITRAALRSLPAESNKVVRRYAAVGWRPRDAFESQALLHFGRERCDRLACAACPVWRGGMQG